MSEELNQQTPSCEHCGSVLTPGRKFCGQCSFPVEGTVEEKTSFRLMVSSRKRFLSDAQDKIKSAKTIIYVLAGLLFVVGIIALTVTDDVLTFAVYLVLCIVYLVLAAWSSKNPFGAILVAFILYITLQLTSAVIDPSTLYKGLILKIVFIGGFIKGIRSAHEAKGYLEELKKFKAAPVDA